MQNSNITPPADERSQTPTSTPAPVKCYRSETVAEILHSDVRAVHRLIHTGKLKAFRIGRQFRITETALLALQQSGIHE